MATSLGENKTVVSIGMDGFHQNIGTQDTPDEYYLYKQNQVL